MIPQTGVPTILDFYQSHELSAHVSRDRLYNSLKKQYYWKGMFQDNNKWVAACTRCSGVKTNVRDCR